MAKIRTATLAERNAGKLIPIPVYDRPELRPGATIIGYARTELGAKRVLRRHGVAFARVYETNARPPCYVPLP